MASPTWVASGTPSHNASATSITPALPGGHSEDDYAIAVVFTTGANSASPSCSGWTLLEGVVGSNTHGYMVAYGKALAASESNPTISFGSGSSGAIVGRVHTFDGVDLTDPVDVTDWNTVTNSTTFDPDDLVTTGPDRLCAHFIGTFRRGVVIDSLNSWTERALTNSSDGQVSSCHTKASSSAETVTSPTWTSPVWTTTTDWNNISVALNPSGLSVSSVDGSGGVPAVTVSAGSTVNLSDAVDAVVGVPAVVVGVPVSATVTLSDAVDASASVPTVALNSGSTVNLADAVDAVVGVPPVSVVVPVSATVTLVDAVDAVAALPAVQVDGQTTIWPDTVEAEPVVGPLIDATAEFNDVIEVGSVDGSSTPQGPLWIADDDSNPAVPTVTVRLFESDGVTEVANALDTSFNVSWIDELNGPGFGRLTIPLSETAAVAELTLHRMVRCYVGGVAAFTWVIHSRPQRREIQIGEEFQQVALVEGRGWASLLDDAIVYPPIPVLESEADLDSPFPGRDRIFSFASPDYPNDDWPNAIKQYEYSQLQATRFQTIDDVEYPAPVGMPFPNSPIYDGLVNPGEQKAYWIWPTYNPFETGFGFFRGLLINPSLGQFTFSVSADNIFTLFVDGVPILGEELDEHMWQGWKEVTVTLNESRWYTVAAVVENLGTRSATNPGGFLLASYYPDIDGEPEFWGMTSNHLWTATFETNTWPGWTPGQIMDRLMVEAAERQVINGAFFWDFQWFSDSQGSLWDTDPRDGEYTPYIPWFDVRVGSSYLSVLEQLRTDGFVDWRMAGGGLMLQKSITGQRSRLCRRGQHRRT
jgi:hypothetical protein